MDYRTAKADQIIDNFDANAKAQFASQGGPRFSGDDHYHLEVGMLRAAVIMLVQERDLYRANVQRLLTAQAEEVDGGEDVDYGPRGFGPVVEREAKAH